MHINIILSQSVTPLLTAFDVFCTTENLKCSHIH